jgi:hypothetical protein
MSNSKKEREKEEPEQGTENFPKSIYTVVHLDSRLWITDGMIIINHEEWDSLEPMVILLTLHICNK